MDPFYLRLILAFVISGTWITFATVAAEKFGSTLGGVLVGMPSNIVVAFFFIGWTQGSQQLFNTTTPFPLTFAVNSIFLLVYAILARRGLILGISGALFVWIVLEIPIVLWNVTNFSVALGAWLIIFLLCFWALEKQPGIRSQHKVTVSYTPASVMWRALLSGTMVSCAVVMSRIGGPMWGSVFASFPAVMTSTLIITSTSGGVDFSRSLTIPLLVSSQVNCMVYALVIRYTVLSLGVVEATIVAYVCAMLSTYLTYNFMKVRQDSGAFHFTRRFFSRI